MEEKGAGLRNHAGVPGGAVAPCWVRSGSDCVCGGGGARPPCTGAPGVVRRSPKACATQKGTQLCSFLRDDCSGVNSNT